MKDFVIEVNNLSKKYNIVHSERGFITLRDKLNGVFAHPIKFFKNIKNNKKELFWALQDISFSVKAGEIVGIIGGNGAGKSTLLKVLSRITPPSAGQAKVRGKVASLLEVGIGFHPELTGRENIFLNGAILGMTKENIVKRFDEIVEFSGVAKFLDTPVKRYSSGMYVRLAFAVAAHMESDILFVDEVLAVGDADFQEKCLGKIGDLVKDENKTILFVSHNLSTIKSLCHRSILLNNGRMIADGPTSEVIEKYLTSKPENSINRVVLTADQAQSISLTALRLSDSVGQTANLFECDQTIAVNFSCQVNQPAADWHGYLAVKDSSGNIILESVSHDNAIDPVGNLEVGQHNFKVVIPARTLAAGRYGLSVSFGREAEWSAEPLYEFELTDNKTVRSNDRNGFFSLLLKWQKEK